MNVTWKPAGYPAVSPYLIVNGAQRVIDFMKQVFDAEVLRRFDMPDGTVMHAEVRIDESVLMLGDASDEWPAQPASLHVYVSDVDAVFARALESGGVSIREPSRRGGDDPDRRGGVRDPGGNSWWIATQAG